MPASVEEGRLDRTACLQLEENATDILEMLRVAFGEHKVGRTHVFNWFTKSKNGVTSVETVQHKGR
jgi:hypothetical protein